MPRASDQALSWNPDRVIFAKFLLLPSFESAIEVVGSVAGTENFGALRGHREIQMHAASDTADFVAAGREGKQAGTALAILAQRVSATFNLGQILDAVAAAAAGSTGYVTATDTDGAVASRKTNPSSIKSSYTCSSTLQLMIPPGIITPVRQLVEVDS